MSAYIFLNCDCLVWSPEVSFVSDSEHAEMSHDLSHWESEFGEVVFSCLCICAIRMQSGCGVKRRPLALPQQARWPLQMV